MRLSELVKVSSAVGATASRLQKVAAIAQFARRLAPEEVSDAVHYLSGQLPQGRVGIGGALLGAMRTVSPSSTTTVTLRDVRDAIDAVEHVGGGGANAAAGSATCTWARAARPRVSTSCSARPSRAWR